MKPDGASKKQSTLSERRLDDWVESYKKFTEISESPKSYHTWAALSCLSSVMQRKTWIKWGHTTIYPNQYIILVGPSGIARKGEPVMIARSFLDSIGIGMIGEDNSRESIIRDIAQSRSEYRYEDKTFYQCSVSCFVEELAVFTGYQNTDLLASLTNWYDSRDRWQRRTKHSGQDEVQGMCFNLLASTAPDWLPHIFTREAIGGGFTSRVVFVVEKGKERLIPNPNEYPPDLSLQEDLLHDLEIINMQVGPFHFEDSAQQEYEKWYIGEETRQKKGRVFEDPVFAGYVGRRATHVKKIAMGLCIASKQTMCSRSIPINIFQSALAIMEDVEEKLDDLFSGIGLARYIQQTDLILDYLKRHGGTASKTDLMSALYRNIDPQSLEGAVNTLTSMGQLHVSMNPQQRSTKYTLMN